MEEGGEGRGDREEGARRMCAAISLDACGCWMGVHGQDLTVSSVDGAHVVTADVARTRWMVLLRPFDLFRP